jgi:hypothetical protein
MLWMYIPIQNTVVPLDRGYSRVADIFRQCRRRLLSSYRIAVIGKTFHIIQ